MQPINGKTMEVPQNEFYGVDVNNREAVKLEFERLQKQHKKITIVVVIALLVLGFFVFDFIRVTELGGKPIFVIEEKIEEGSKFKGIGYEVVYCRSGERFVGPIVYKKCVTEDPVTISNLVYKKFVDYAVDKKILNKDLLDNLEFNLVELDSNNKDGSSDYHVNLKYLCKKGEKCLTFANEYYSGDNINLYVRLDKYNEVSKLMSFKTTGVYYNRLVEVYSDKVQSYLVNNNMVDVNNLRDFKVSLVQKYGKYKIKDVDYADSYLIQITYLCSDNTNKCIYALDNVGLEGEFTNLMFYASMFVDVNNDVLLLETKEYFDK